MAKQRAARLPDIRAADLREAGLTIGDTAEKRLRWVAEFVRRPLPAHSADTAKAGDCLLALWPPYEGGAPALSRDDVAWLHAEIRALLCDAVAGSVGFTRWPDEAGGLWLHRMSGVGEKPARWTAAASENYAERPRSGILRAVYSLVLAGGSRLLACRECQAPFVGQKRQEYCEELCSQRARTRTFTENKRAREKAKKGSAR